MPILRELQENLDRCHIKYQVMTQSLAYPAQEVAAAQHVPGRHVANSASIRHWTGRPPGALSRGDD
jgi:hypothetical protein